MAWYEDLTPCSYLGEEAGRVLRAVGWLRGRLRPCRPSLQYLGC
jgi:hypothetical protein